MMTKYCFRLFIGLLLLQTSHSFAQDKASFFADTLINMHNEKWKDSSSLGGRSWTIQNKTFSFGETITVDPKLNMIDTIYFRLFANRDIDTILCVINEARDYRFVFNPCCGFNVHSNENPKKKIAGGVIFETKKNHGDSTYAASTGSTGAYIVDKKTEPIYDICASAMISSITYLKFGKVAECKEDEECFPWFCNFTDDIDEEDVDNYANTIIESAYGFKYIRLSSKPLRFIYDVKKEKLKIKKSK